MSQQNHRHPQNQINASVLGVLLIDKPSGPTCQQLLQKVRRQIGAHRAGHIGTLDPLASGLLPLIFGDATRYAFGWERANKIYRATIRLGGISTTDDSQGKITPLPIPPTLTLSAIHQAFAPMIGEIEQIPPLYSAVRIGGQQLFKWARKKAEEPTLIPTRQPRKVRIDAINVLDYRALNQEIDIEVACGSGTFIRAIARDLGTALGCGGYISALRRIGFADQSIEDALDWDIWQSHIRADTWRAQMLSPEIMLQAFPKIALNDRAHYRLVCGQILSAAEIEAELFIPPPKTPTDRRYRLYFHERLIGMGEMDDEGRLQAGRMMPTDPLPAAL